MQAHGEAAVALLLEQLVRAAVPDLDRAGAVVALRDLALEGPVLERMVLDVDGKVLLARLERDALRDGPRGEDAVALEAKVVVEPPGVMPLDDEDRRLALPRLPPNGSGVCLRSRLRSYSESFLLTPLLSLLPALPVCVRSTDSRSACIRSMTCGSSSDGSGSGWPFAFERMSSSSSERYVSSYRSGSNFALRFSTRDFAISTSAFCSPLGDDVAATSAGSPHLVRVVHRLENQDAFPGPEAREVLLVPDHDLRDPDLARSRRAPRTRSRYGFSPPSCGTGSTPAGSRSGRSRRGRRSRRCRSSA